MHVFNRLLDISNVIRADLFNLTKHQEFIIGNGQASALPFYLFVFALLVFSSINGFFAEIILSHLSIV